jgi:hypothetical protein
MPSPKYYRRQSDTLLMLALTATDPELSDRYRSLAAEYASLAEKAAEAVCPPLPAIGEEAVD